MTVIIIITITVSVTKFRFTGKSVESIKITAHTK